MIGSNEQNPNLDMLQNSTGNQADQQTGELLTHFERICCRGSAEEPLHVTRRPLRSPTAIGAEHAGMQCFIKVQAKKLPLTNPTWDVLCTAALWAKSKSSVLCWLVRLQWTVAVAQERCWLCFTEHKRSLLNYLAPSAACLSCWQLHESSRVQTNMATCESTSFVFFFVFFL